MAMADCATDNEIVPVTIVRIIFLKMDTRLFSDWMSKRCDLQQQSRYDDRETPLLGESDDVNLDNFATVARANTLQITCGPGSYLRGTDERLNLLIWAGPAPQAGQDAQVPVKRRPR